RHGLWCIRGISPDARATTGLVEQRQDLAAITLGNRVHALGAVTGIVLEDRPTGFPASELVGGREILHAEADIGFGIVEALGGTAIAHHPRCGRLDLHKADFARAA